MSECVCECVCVSVRVCVSVYVILSFSWLDIDIIFSDKVSHLFIQFVCPLYCMLLLFFSLKGSGSSLYIFVV